MANTRFMDKISKRYGPKSLDTGSRILGCGSNQQKYSQSQEPKLELLALDTMAFTSRMIIIVIGV
jgi:hypothetical protein